MKRVAGVVAAGLLVSLVVPTLARQTLQPVPRFRAGVDLVVLDVSVLDRERSPVRGLTADDFTILEDGRPQRVAAFSAIDLPDAVEEAPAEWTREVGADVTRNLDSADSRVIVILLDDGSPMNAYDVPRVKQVAHKVIDQLGPRDQATVVFALDRRSGQEFTQDRTRLRAAVNRFNGAAPQTMFGESPTTFAPSASTLYFQVVDRLRGVAEYLGDLPQRRKALVFLSVGIPINIDDATPKGMQAGTMDRSGIVQQLLQDVQHVYASAQRANVAIYGLDIAGLTAPAPALQTIDAETGALSGGGLDPNPGRFNRSFLQALSENTGGFAIADVNNPVPGIRQILRENASYYLLAYATPNARTDGRFRKIDVRVRRPGVIVRARNGYFEPTTANAGKSAREPSRIDKAIAGVLPVSDVQMQVSAIPFGATGRRQSAVAIVLGVRERSPTRATRLARDVDLRVLVHSPDGRQRASTHQTIPITLNSPSPGGTMGYELLSRVVLAPGRYYVRVGIETSLHGVRLSPRAPAVGFVGPGEDTSSRAGSVYCDVDVPDFANEALSLSGAVLSVSPGVVSGPKDALASIVPVVPTTLREFTREDEVSAFVRVYQGGRKALGSVVLEARIVDANGAMAFETKETLDAGLFAKDRAADYFVPMPISRLKGGRYLFTISAASGSARTIRRDVRFDVR